MLHSTMIYLGNAPLILCISSCFSHWVEHSSCSLSEFQKTRALNIKHEVRNFASCLVLSTGKAQREEGQSETFKSTVFADRGMSALNKPLCLASSALKSYLILQHHIELVTNTFELFYLRSLCVKSFQLLLTECQDYSA